MARGRLRSNLGGLPLLFVGLLLGGCAGAAPQQPALDREDDLSVRKAREAARSGAKDAGLDDVEPVLELAEQKEREEIQADIAAGLSGPSRSRSASERRFAWKRALSFGETLESAAAWVVLVGQTERAALLEESALPVELQDASRDARVESRTRSFQEKWHQTWAEIEAQAARAGQDARRERAGRPAGLEEPEDAQLLADVRESARGRDEEEVLRYARHAATTERAERAATAALDDELRSSLARLRTGVRAAAIGEGLTPGEVEAYVLAAARVGREKGYRDVQLPIEVRTRAIERGLDPEEVEAVVADRSATLAPRPHFTVAEEAAPGAIPDETGFDRLGVVRFYRGLDRARGRVARFFEHLDARQLADRLDVVFSRHHAIVLPGGEAFVAGGEDGLRIRQAGSDEAIGVLSRREGPVTAGAVSPDGARLLVGGFRSFDRFDDPVDRWLGLYDLGAGTLVRRVAAHEGLITCVVFSPDGREALAGSEDGTARLFVVADLSCTRTLGRRGGAAVLACAFAGSTRTALVGRADASLELWSLEDASATAVRLPADPGRGPVLAIACTPDGTALVGRFDGTIERWDTAARRELATVGRHADAVTALTVAPGGSLLISTGWDHAVRCWDLRPTQAVPMGTVALELTRSSCDWPALGLRGSSLAVVVSWDGGHACRSYPLPEAAARLLRR